MADVQEKELSENKGKQLCPTAQQQQQPQLPRWVLVWFYVTALVCTWDASFIMLRPLSLPGGSLAWVWYAYKYYITVDQRYLDTKDAYVYAQSLMNYAEVVINVIAIVMHYRHSRHTVPTAFMVSVMTMWKTVLYFLMFSDLCTGSQYRQGNDALEEIFLMVIPNGVWILVPIAAMVVLWGSLVPDTEPLKQRGVMAATVAPGVEAVIGRESARKDTSSNDSAESQWFSQSQREDNRDAEAELLQEGAHVKRLPLSLTTNVKHRAGVKAGGDRK